MNHFYKIAWRRVHPLLLSTLAIVWLFAISSPASLAGIQIEPDQTSIGKIYLIAVGLNKYGDHSATGILHDLGSAVNDAQGVAGLFKDQKPMPDVDVQLLVDDQATKQNILKAFDHVANTARPEDLFIFYFAGNGDQVNLSGSAEGQGFYLFLSGCNASTIPELARVSQQKGLSATDLRLLRAKIQTIRQVYVLDTSDQASSFETFVDQATEPSAPARALEATNVILLTSEGRALDSVDLPNGTRVNHGVLTYALLQALSGEADLVYQMDTVAVPGITARELEAYLSQEVITLSQGQQVLQSYSWGTDFALIPTPSANHPATRAFGPALPVSPVQTAVTATPAKGKDYALFFATDKYDKRPSAQLENPIDDANALAKELQDQYGFQTQVVENPTREEIVSTLASYRARTYQPGDQLLVYFAGHGAQSNNDGFIVPSNSPGDDPDTDPNGYFEDAELKTVLTHFPCQHILLILDICYGGKFGDAVTRLVAPSTPEDASLLSNSLETAFTTSPAIHLASQTEGPEGVYTPVDSQTVALRLMKDKTREFMSSSYDQAVPEGDAGLHSPFAANLLQTLHTSSPKGFLTAHDLFSGAQSLQVAPDFDIFDKSNPQGDFVFLETKTSSLPANQ